MFSIIVCSIRPAQAERLRKNIADTIGVPHEFIAFDNRNTGRGICSVYNECARRAACDLLCFVHEDVEFTTQGWGAILAAKLSDPRCGVIGFAGGAIKLRSITGWMMNYLDERICMYQDFEDGKPPVFRQHNPDRGDYSRVVALDGLCLLCRRDVWAASPFDEQLLKGFHAYDLDFTTAAACRYENYVCNLVAPTHFSAGRYTQSWVDGMKTYHAKWHDRLPMFTGEVPPPDKIRALELWAHALWLRKLMRQQLLTKREALGEILAFIGREPQSCESWKMLWKFVRWCTVGSLR